MTLKKKILVTGGAGFLGSHLCERLLNDGHEVICVDNFYTGKTRNISHLISHPYFKFKQQDICIPLEFEVDQIYNLACPASPIHYQADPIFTLKTCIQGAINLLSLANRTGALILQASTSEVYGDPEIHPQRETYWGHVNPVGKRSCYDEGKRCAETLFFSYRQKYGIPLKVVRIFNTYGPRMHPQDGRVVSNFIVQALSGQAITIYGNGEQTRSFCYVDDLIEGMIRMMNSRSDFIGPVNLGNPNEIPIKALANAIIQITGSRSQLNYMPLPSDDPMRRKPDITLAKNELHWSPAVSLEDGLLKTIAYFKQLSQEKPEGQSVNQFKRKMRPEKPHDRSHQNMERA